MTEATPSKRIFEDASSELSARRTGMSFQRTRLSAERTLMSYMRTSISLISFGFTIYQFFGKLKQADVIGGEAATRNFGQALVWLGIGMLAFGIFYHVQFMNGLRREREAMKADGLIHAGSTFPLSLTLVVALVFLFFGLGTIISMRYHIGPFG